MWYMSVIQDTCTASHLLQGSNRNLIGFSSLAGSLAWSSSIVVVRSRALRLRLPIRILIGWRPLWSTPTPFWSSCPTFPIQPYRACNAMLGDREHRSSARPVRVRGTSRNESGKLPERKLPDDNDQLRFPSNGCACPDYIRSHGEVAD